MTTSQRQAIITLIDKKGKDRSYLENWRPISLVNVDAKIASKVIANRIKCCLPDIIHHNQTGFYSDLLLWWEEFRNTFSDINYAQRIIWNNKDIRIDNRSVFYKLYYENGIVYICDLIFESDNKQSYDFYRQKGLKTYFLTWTGLRVSVPKELRSCELLPDSANFKLNDIQFDVYRANKCKHFYKLLITAKAKLPNMS